MDTSPYLTNLTGYKVSSHIFTFHFELAKHIVYKTILRMRHNVDNKVLIGGQQSGSWKWYMLIEIRE